MVGSILNAYRNAYQGLPREIWILSIALFVNRSGAMVLPFLTLYLHEQRGFSEGFAAKMIACYGLGSLLGVMAGGWLTDRVGSVRLMSIMLLGSVPLFLILPYMESLGAIVLNIFFLAFFAEGVRPANNAAVGEYSSKEQLTRSYGLQRMAVNLGVSFGPAIGGILAEIDFNWLFICDAATTFCGAAAVLYWLGFPPPASRNLNGETHSMEADRPPYQDRYFLMFLGLLLLTAIVFFQFHATYPLFLKEHFQLTKKGIGFLFAVNTVIVVIFEMLLLDQVKGWNLLKLIGWGCALSCLGFGILPFSSAIWFAVFSMFVITVGEMLAMPLATSWVGHRASKKHRGIYMGWYAMTYSVAGVIAPLLGGAIYDWNRNLFWYLSIGVGFIVLAGFYALNRVLPDSETSNSI